MLSFDPKDENSVKVLGLHWDTSADTFGYHTSQRQTSYSKRGVLSTIARLFDPIGSLGLLMMWAKSFMQELWNDKLDWDAALPKHLCMVWDQFLTELPSIQDISIPWHIDINTSSEIQLLGFADASQKGYPATIYLRVIHLSGEISVHFVSCKTKVAPKKTAKHEESLTIPRLELCAALLLAQSMSHVNDVLSSKIKITRLLAWTDSSIILSWLTAEQRFFKIFVTNRVEKIHSLLPQGKWFHVSTRLNPADPSSRGLLPVDMAKSQLHWKGPDFITLSEDQWPASNFTILNVQDLPEVKKTMSLALVTQNVQKIDCLLSRFSSLSKLQRVLAYVLRFVYSKLLRQPTFTGVITSTEINRAMFVLIRMTQKTHFPALLSQLNKPNCIITPPTIAQLAPFLDSNGLIRVGGRLRHASVDSDTKHPFLLPKSSSLTSLLIPVRTERFVRI